MRFTINNTIKTNICRIRWFSVLLILVLGWASATIPDTTWVNNMFNVDGEAIIPEFDDSYGVAFQDINNDGLPDLYITRFRELNRLLINNGEDIAFSDETIRTELGGNLTPHRLQNLELGSSSVDFDNDGLKDVLTIGWGKTTVLQQQQREMNFTDVSVNLNLRYPISGNAGIWTDVNIDGNLDLFITDEHGSNHLYMQIQPEVFDEQSEHFGLDENSISQGAAFGDLNADGYPDLYICNWFEPDNLYLNKGGIFFEKAPIVFTHLTDSLNSNGVTFGDIDNDGDLDILVTDRNRTSKLYRNDLNPSNKSISFTDITDSSLLMNNYPAYSGMIADLNNDGLQDIYFTNIGPNQLFLNREKLKFELVHTQIVEEYEYPDANYSTGAAIADLENDGDLDLFVSNKDYKSELYLNPLQTGDYIRFEIDGSL